MKKAFVATLAAGAFAAAVATAPAPAQAASSADVVAAGIGGLALGAIIGANAQPVYVYPAYRPAPGYVVYTGYRSRVPVACPGGFWGRKPVAFDRAGRPVAWSKPRWFCP